MSNVKTATIRISDLTTDARVQRPLDTRRVETIAGKFNPAALGSITVSQRHDGSRIVLDGQTRTAAAKAIGYKGDIHAHIYTGLTLAEEASMFLSLNNTKQVSALDKFLVRLTEGDEIALDINRIAKGYGWTIKPGGANWTIQSVNALEKAYGAGGTNGAFVVDRILKTITEAWAGHAVSGNAGIIAGLGLLFVRYGADVRGDKLVRELQNQTPRTLLGRARSLQDGQGGSLAAAVGRLTHTLHNNKLKTNILGEWK